MSIEFDHIISLGADCQVALQLRRVGWHQTPSVFDWLITPWDSMMDVLVDEGARLSKQFYPSHDGRGLACSSYNLVYWHEFPRDVDHHAVFSPQAAEQARQKLLHKMARMREACESSGCVLFIRAGLNTDATIDRFARGESFSGDHLDRCCALIASRYPGLRFSLLFLDKGFPIGLQKPSDPRVTCLNLPALFTSHQDGSGAIQEQAWNDLFAQIPYAGGKQTIQWYEGLPG